MQKLIWIPGAAKNADKAKKKVPPVPYKGKIPVRLWILYLHTYPDKKPELPYSPVNGVNAYLESYQHDWSIYDGFLRYHSHSSTVYLLKRVLGAFQSKQR